MQQLKQTHQLTIGEDTWHYRLYNWWKNQPEHFSKNPPQDLCTYCSMILRGMFLWFFRRGEIMGAPPWAFCFIASALLFIIIGSIVSAEIRRDVITGIIFFFFLGVITILWNILKWLATEGFDRLIYRINRAKARRTKRRLQKAPKEPKVKGTPFYKLIWVYIMSKKRGSRLCPLITLPVEKEVIEGQVEDQVAE